MFKSSVNKPGWTGIQARFPRYVWRVSFTSYRRVAPSASYGVNSSAQPHSAGATTEECKPDLCSVLDGLQQKAEASGEGAWLATSIGGRLVTAVALAAVFLAANCNSDVRHVNTASVAVARVAPTQISRSASRRPLAMASISASQLVQQQSEAFCEALAYLNYKVLQVLTLPTWGKVLTLLAVGAPILIAGSAALCAWTGLKPGAALMRCYLSLNNVPGADIASEEDPRVALVLNMVYTVGLLTFAVMIGVLGDDIASAVEAGRLGNSRVPERNHTVVLGYNRQLIEVLRQVANVRADRGAAAFPGQLVVLSELDRGTLERMLLDALGPAAAAGVVTRQGSALKLTDLQRVSAGHARTVIVLAPDEGQAEAAGPGAPGEAAGGDVSEAEEGGSFALSLEAKQAVTLAALQHLRRQALEGPGGLSLGANPQTVVVQHDADLGLDPVVYGEGARIDAEGNEESGPVTAKHMVTRVSHLNSLSRIQAQCASQPGLSVVMSSIMQQQPGMPEFYVQRFPQVANITYGEARRLFPRAVLCGVYDASTAATAATASAEARLDAEAKAVVLNPPDSTKLLERYSLILLADRTEDLRISGPQPLKRGGKSNTAAQHQRVRPQQQQPATPLGTEPAPGVASPGAGGEGEVEQLSGGVLRTRAEQGAAPLRVVVLAFNGQQPEELVEALSDYCPAGSEAVLVAGEGTPAAREAGHGRRLNQRLRVSTFVGDPRSRGSLRQAGAHEADAVIIAGLERVNTDEADAQALATLLQLQALMPPAAPAASTHLHPRAAATMDGGAAEGRPPLNLVCAVTDPRTREIMSELVQVQSGAGAGPGEVARRQMTLEAVNADELLAGVLTQVAAEPRLSGLFHELSTVDGVEIHLRTPGALELPHGQPLTWAQIEDAGRERDVTVIGLLRAPGGGAPEPRLLLGVPLGHHRAAVELKPGDKVVVLSGD